MTNNKIPRQSAHGDKHQSFNSNLANEFERWLWKELTYERKNNKPNNHYDYSRHEQNFEINSKGEIIPLGSQSDSLQTRLMNRLDELHFKFYYDKNGNISQNSPNCCVSFVVGGDTDVMNKLAWGDQKVDFSKEGMGKANWNVKRQEDIEKWAMDEYSFFCKEYGKENVIGFSVHLDETTPHAHVLIVPTAMRKKFGRTKEYQNMDNPSIRIGMKAHDNLPAEEKKKWKPVDDKEYIESVSYNKVFGNSPDERSLYMKGFHTRHYEAVGKKYGLARGRDLDSLPEEEREKAKHRSKAEYHRFKEAEEEYDLLKESIDVLKKKKSSLIKEIIDLLNKKKENRKELKKQEKAKKGLNSMILHLQNDHDRLVQEIQDLESDKSSTSNDIDTKKQELATVDAKLLDKQQKLQEAEDKHEKAELQLAELLKKEGEMKARIIQEAKDITDKAERDANSIREQAREDAEDMKHAPAAALGQKVGELLGKDKTKKELQRIKKEYSDYKDGEQKRISNAEKKGRDDAMKTIMDMTHIRYTKESGKNKDEIIPPEKISSFIIKQTNQINSLKNDVEEAKKVQIEYSTDDEELREAGKTSLLKEISRETGLGNLSKESIIEKLKGSDNLKSENSNLLSEIKLQTSNNEIKDMAIALFLGGSGTVSGGGGGNTSDLRWDGRNKDENDRDYYNRCLAFAKANNGIHKTHKTKKKGISL